VNIQALLSEKVSQALIAAGAPADCEPQVRQSAKVQFGDYQANGVMAVAKKLGMAPRQLAEQVLSHLDLNGIANKVEIAGPGFINIFLDPPSWRTTSTARCSLSVWASPAAGADYRRRLLGAERGERDARRPSAFHHHWRCRGPYAGVSRS
jgi:hypothetical protein